MVEEFVYKGEKVIPHLEKDAWFIQKDGKNLYMPQYNGKGHTIYEFLDVFGTEPTDHLFAYLEDSDRYCVIIVSKEEPDVRAWYSYDSGTVYSIKRTAAGWSIFNDGMRLTEIPISDLGDFLDKTKETIEYGNELISRSDVCKKVRAVIEERVKFYSK